MRFLLCVLCTWISSGCCVSQDQHLWNGLHITSNNVEDRQVSTAAEKMKQPSRTIRGKAQALLDEGRPEHNGGATDASVRLQSLLKVCYTKLAPVLCVSQIVEE